MTPARLRGALAQTWAHLFPLSPVVEGERITYRKHWFILVKSLTLPLALLVAVLGGWWYALSSGMAAGLRGWGLGLAVGFFPIAWLLWRYENWRNDYYVISQERIIDVLKLPLGLRTEIKEAPLRNIQNVSLKIPSFIAASLDFGDIEVDTAGKEGQLTFQSIAHPRQVLEEVVARADAYRAQEEARERERRYQEIQDWLMALAELGRVNILRHPPIAPAGGKVEVEWRVSGPATAVETGLFWDVTPHPDLSYPYATPSLRGGAGNYQDSLLAPPAPRLYFRVYARVDGPEYWTPEQVVPITTPGERG